jgi:hypothetical protein
MVIESVVCSPFREGIHEGYPYKGSRTLEFVAHIKYTGHFAQDSFSLFGIVAPDGSGDTGM